MAMYTVGKMVNDLQFYDTNLPVNDLLQDSTFIDHITTIISAWPNQSRKTLGVILRDSKRADTSIRHSIPSEEALRAIFKVRRIALPASLGTVYQSWLCDPAVFWRSEGFCLGSGNISQVYKGMKQLEIQRHSGTIVWRYFTVFFYDLMHLVGAGRKYLVETLQHKLVKAIDSSGLLEDADTIQTDLKRWARAGSKYHNITTRLGNGSLMLLPQEVTDNIWETRLPMKGACFEAAIAHLIERGIRDISNEICADILGSKVREFILEPFRWLMDSSPSPEIIHVTNGTALVSLGNDSQVRCEGPRSVQAHGSDTRHSPVESMPALELVDDERYIGTGIARGWWLESEPLQENFHDAVDFAAFDLFHPMDIANTNTCE